MTKKNGRTERRKKGGREEQRVCGKTTKAHIYTYRFI